MFVFYGGGSFCVLARQRMVLPPAMSLDGHCQQAKTLPNDFASQWSSQ